MSLTPNALNGLTFYTHEETGAIFIPLPSSAWTPALPGLGPCSCPDCAGKPDNVPMWDTLVIPGDNDRHNIRYTTTYTIHAPGLQVGRLLPGLTLGHRK
jgi:hypothetical protein